MKLLKSSAIRLGLFIYLYSFRFKIHNSLLLDSCVCPACYSDLNNEIIEKQHEEYLGSQQSSSQSQKFSQFSNFSTGDEGQDLKQEENIEKIQEAFLAADQSPLKLDKAHDSNYFLSKVQSLGDGIRKVLKLSPLKQSQPTLEEIIANVCKEIVGKSKPETLKLLAIMPKDWGFSEYHKTFGISRRHYNDVKFYQDHGEIPVRKVRSDKKDQHVIDMIHDFYLSPGVTRQMPGKSPIFFEH